MQKFLWMSYVASTVATRDDVQRVQSRLVTVETTLEGMDRRLIRVETSVRAMDAKLTNVEKNMVLKGNMRRVEAKMTKMGRSLNRRMGSIKNAILKAVDNLATTTPTQKDFGKLKARVDKYHPLAN